MATGTATDKVPASPAKRAAISLIITVGLTAAAALMFGDRAYLWIKSVHVIAIISWMAGMLYLPRLFIYHCDAEKGSVQSDTFKVMERRLLTIIMNPAMVIAWALGMWLAWTGNFLSSPWFHGKLALALRLSWAHGYFSASVRAFAEDRNTKPPRHWRIINEVPTVLMIGIVILVIVKPF
ncbi:MAG: protoporphyrinogen oxidase HemJ [Hyphomicrobium sp.]